MKFTAYILLVALFVATLGNTLFFFPQLQFVRQDMQQQLAGKEKSLVLTFTPEAFAQIVWTRKKKEFRFHGKMYDVRSIRHKGSAVRVFCLFDREETGLRQKLKDFFTPSSHKNRPLRHAVKVLSQKYFATGIFSLFLFRPLYSFSAKPYLFPVSVFANGFIGPPPKA